MIQDHFSERAGGILLHPTSLPGRFGIGTLGPEARDFIGFLKDAGQKLWQVLPLGPTGYGDSPYQCFSAFAGNPLLISLERLKEDGLVSARDLSRPPRFDLRRVDYGRVIEYKIPILEKAFESFRASAGTAEKKKLDAFRQETRSWIGDYSLFMAFKDLHGGHPWWEWDRDIRFRTPSAVRAYTLRTEKRARFYQFLQHIFYLQWADIRTAANKAGIRIIGDIPIFVSPDSADAWARPEMFLFDRNRRPLKVAGVPPDYFSKTGQLWGNPLYRWQALKRTGYRWWIDRFRNALELTDIVRLDHFRGFAGYWSVPSGQKTAVRGRWEKGPGSALFDAVTRSLGTLPVIAEDLGVITPDVVELRERYGLPGMKILQFAFDSDAMNPYLPHRYPVRCVAYTGTHDNDTSAGWFRNLPDRIRRFASDYLDIVSPRDASWKMIRAAWSSPAVFALAPFQDFLGLGGDARMNTPSTSSGNWQWRFSERECNARLAERLRNLSGTFGR